MQHIGKQLLHKGTTKSSKRVEVDRVALELPVSARRPRSLRRRRRLWLQRSCRPFLHRGAALLLSLQCRCCVAHHPRNMTEQCTLGIDPIVKLFFKGDVPSPRPAWKAAWAVSSEQQRLAAWALKLVR